jgi:hypothetical protein
VLRHRTGISSKLILPQSLEELQEIEVQTILDLKIAEEELDTE